MTMQQAVLALAPLVVLVILLVVMIRVSRDHPERIATLKTWGIIAGGIGVIVQIYDLIRQH